MCYQQHLQPATIMMNVKLLVFSCILFSISNGHRQWGGGRGRNDIETAVDAVTGTAVCPKRVIKHLDGCCSIPVLVPQEILNACYYSERGWGTVSSTTPATRQAGEAPLPEGGADDAPTDAAVTENMPMRVAERLTQGDDSSSESDSNDDDGGERGPIRFAGHRGRGCRGYGCMFLDFAAFGFGGRRSGNGQKIGMCVADCAFQKMKLIGSDGKLDVAAIRSKFGDSQSVNDEWRPIVNEAITNCTTRVEGTNLTSYGPAINAVGRACNQAPALLRRCIRHYLAVNCIKSAALNSEDLRCISQKTTLKTCDPLAQNNRNRGLAWGNGFRRGGFGGQYLGGQQEVQEEMGRGRRRNRNKHADANKR